MLIPTALVIFQRGPPPLDPTAYTLFVVCEQSSVMLYMLNRAFTGHFLPKYQFRKDNNHIMTYTMTRLAFA